MKTNLPSHSRHGLTPRNMLGRLLHSLLGSSVGGTCRSGALLRGSRSSRSKRLGVVHLTGWISWERRSWKCVRDRHLGNYLKNLDVVRVTFIRMGRGFAPSTNGRNIRIRDKFLRVRFSVVRGIAISGPRKSQNLGIF